MSAKKVCAKRLRQMKKSRAKWNFFAHLALGSGSPGWAYSIAMVQHLSVIHTFKHEYLWGQVANLDEILFEASLWLGKDCIRVGSRSDENPGFHGKQKLPLTYNGEMLSDR